MQERHSGQHQWLLCKRSSGFEPWLTQFLKVHLTDYNCGRVFVRCVVSICCYKNISDSQSYLYLHTMSCHSFVITINVGILILLKININRNGRNDVNTGACLAGREASISENVNESNVFLINKTITKQYQNLDFFLNKQAKKSYIQNLNKSNIFLFVWNTIHWIVLFNYQKPFANFVVAVDKKKVESDVAEQRQDEKRLKKIR